MTSRRTALPHFSQLVTGGVACISNQDFEPSSLPVLRLMKCNRAQA